VSAQNAAREAALILLAFCIVEGRALNLLDVDAGDLRPGVPRIGGDRAVSEYLSKEVLDPLGIPATRGAFQSSTYRSGYLAAQAHTPAVAALVRWISAEGRTLAELKALFDNVAIAVAADAFVVPPLPELDVPAFAFPAFIELVDRLLATQSQGAFEQYLFAALLTQYMETATERRLRVVTKPLFQSDASAGTAGDVDVRAGQNLEAVYEVTANNWRTKLPQAIDALVERDEITSITILAGDSLDEANQLMLELEQRALPPGVQAARLDIAVLAVKEECRSLAAKLGKRDRSRSITHLYDYLVKFCKAKPELVSDLIDALDQTGLTVPAPADE